MKEAALIFILRLFALMSLSVARAFGRLLGRLSWTLQTRMARTSVVNLRLCFPWMGEMERQLLAKASLLQTFQTLTETGAIWLWPAPRTLALISAVEGLAILQAAKNEGKGVIVLAPHLGNWELLGLYLGAFWRPSSQLYQPPASLTLSKLVFQARSRSGAHMVATDPKGVAELLKALRSGGIAGILPDQVPPVTGGVFAPFFGVPALTMTLLNRLQQKTGARVVVGFARREDKGFRIIFREPAPSIYGSELSGAVAGLNRSIEMVVQEVPVQYQWGYKRFKRQPEGHKDPYAN